MMTIPWLAILGIALVIGAVFVVWMAVGWAMSGFDRRFPGRRRQLGVTDRRFVDIASPFRRSAQVKMMLTAAENSFLKRVMGSTLSTWSVLTGIGLAMLVFAATQG